MRLIGETDVNQGVLNPGAYAAENAIANKQASQVDTATAEIQPEFAEVIQDLNQNNFSAAWNVAEGTAKDFSTTSSAYTTDPLLQDLESSSGLQALDPTKTWTASEEQSYYKALGSSAGYTNGNLLGQNPYGLWGSGADVTGGQDAAANLSQEGATPDVERFAGQTPPASFLAKYGGDIAALAIAAVTVGAGSELSAGLLTAEAGTDVAAGSAAAEVAAATAAGVGTTEAALTAGAAYGVAGAAGAALTDVVTGKPVTLGSVAGGALGAGLTAGTSSYLANSGLSAAEATAAGGLAGAGIGAVKGELTGGNVELDAAIGGISGATQASGVTNQVKGYLSSEGASPTVAGLAAGAAVGAGEAGAGALAANALTSSPGGSSVSVPANLAVNTNPGATAQPADTGFLGGLESGLGNSLGTSSTGSLSNLLGNLTGNLAPYAAVGAIGEAEASKGQSQDAAYSQQLQGLAQPSLGESNQLLQNYQSGVINPTDQAVVNTMTQQGQSTINSASGLSSIAQAAFQSYQNSQLEPAQQTQLDQQTAAQKQQVAQQLASAGITDSTILAAQYQNIDNNALITKQTLLNQNFQTGTAAYDQWLQATTEGQQTIQQGMEFASTSLNTELTNSMSEANIGIGEMNTAITTQMQTDQEYANQVSTLMGTLASAYAKQVAGQKSGAASSANNLLGSLAGGAASGLSSGGIFNTASNGTVTVANNGQDSFDTTGGSSVLDNLGIQSDFDQLQIGNEINADLAGSQAASQAGDDLSSLLGGPY